MFVYLPAYVFSMANPSYSFYLLFKRLFHSGIQFSCWIYIVMMMEMTLQLCLLLLLRFCLYLLTVSPDMYWFDKTGNFTRIMNDLGIGGYLLECLSNVSLTYIYLQNEDSNLEH